MSWAGWRRVERGFWWCPDFGTAIRKPDGWWASRSGYPRTVLLDPVVGPFRTAGLAIGAYEKAMRERKHMENAVCRACKKRPAATRKPVEDPVLAKALEHIRRKNDGLCHECACARMSAAIDQSIEKIARG